MKINIDEIGMKIKILDDKKTKAIITLDLGDFVIKGFRVAESKFENHKGDKLRVLPPSYVGGGGYHPMFFMPDKELWKELEMKLWDGYYNATKEHHRKKLGISNEEWEKI